MDFFFVICVLCLSCCLVCYCSLVVTCWEWADLLALLYVTFYYVSVALSCGVLAQVWYFVVSITDLAFFLTLMLELPLLFIVIKCT